MSKFISIIITIASIVLLNACNCEKICVALEEEYREWLIQEPGDTITYINSLGNEIKFAVDSFKSGKGYIYDCGPDGLGGCACDGFCQVTEAFFYAHTSDSSRTLYDTSGRPWRYYTKLGIKVEKYSEKKDSAVIIYTVFDHSNYLTISPSIRLNINDTLLPSFSAGGTTYTNVILHNTDTTIRFFPMEVVPVYFVRQSYYNKQHGIIAFFDSKTQSLFYKKP